MPINYCGLTISISDHPEERTFRPGQSSGSEGGFLPAVRHSDATDATRPSRKQNQFGKNPI